MARIRWQRSAAWRQARAMETGKSVDECMERELEPAEIAALPEDLRRLLIRDGRVEDGTVYSIKVPYVGSGEATIHSLSDMRYEYAYLEHDSDTLEGEDVARVLRAALAKAGAEAKEKRGQAMAEEFEQAGLAQEYRRALTAYWANSDAALDAGGIEEPRPPTGLNYQRAGDIDREFRGRQISLDSYRQGQAEAAKAREAAEALSWIEAHGSPRLRALVREKIEYDRVYRDERIAAERPGWQWGNLVCGDIGEIQGVRVTEAHLAALEETRKTVPDAKLAWLGEGEHTKGCVCPDVEDEETGERKPAVRRRPVLVAMFLDREIVREVEEGQ